MPSITGALNSQTHNHTKANASLSLSLSLPSRDRFHVILSDPYIKMPSLKTELAALLEARCTEAGVSWQRKGEASPGQEGAASPGGAAAAPK